MKLQKYLKNVSEKICSIDFEGNNIWGILNEPSQSLKTKTIIVFTHGMAGYRIGPHQMFVEYARKLADIGFYCFRFDFLGNGFGDADTKNISENHRIKQLQKVVNTLKYNYNFQKIGLLGICSGAFVSFQLSFKIKIDYLLLLSMLPLNRESKELAYRNSLYNFKNFANKLAKRETWVKLITNDLNFTVLITRYLKNIKLFFSLLKIKKEKKEIKSVVPAEYDVDVLLIYGENDPEAKTSLSQIKQSLAVFKIPYDIHFIKDANHSFYSLTQVELFSSKKR